MRTRRWIAALTLCAAGAAGSAALAGRAPEGPTRGSFRGGALVGGARVPDEGLDHYLLFPPRCGGAAVAQANAWGHPDVVATVLDVVREVRRAVPGAQRLPVGELSGPAGGKIPHHLSHQNGLDVDIFFGRRNATPPGGAATAAPTPLDTARELPRCAFGPSYEKRDPATGRFAVTPDFDRELAWRTAERFAARPEVQVIFVGGLLKEELGRWARERGLPSAERARTMGKLYAVYCRPPKGVTMDTYRGNWCPHDDHLHVRFRCPRDSPTCRAK